MVCQPGFALTDDLGNASERPRHGPPGRRMEPADEAATALAEVGKIIGLRLCERLSA